MQLWEEEKKRVKKHTISKKRALNNGFEITTLYSI